jgi:hypothetical protein
MLRGGIGLGDEKLSGRSINEEARRPRAMQDAGTHNARKRHRLVEAIMANSNRILVKLRPSIGLAAADPKVNLRPLYGETPRTNAFGIADAPAWYCQLNLMKSF